VVDLRDRMCPSCRAQFIGAEKPRKIAARIAHALALDAFEARQRQIDDCEAAQANTS
jgi:hypothetical protein